MNWFRSKHSLLLVTACVAILAMRVTGVHLHLCFDGQEPAQSLHWTDAGIHESEAHVASTHSDVDLSLFGDALIKKLPSGFDLPALLGFVFALFTLSLVPVSHRPDRAQVHSKSRDRYFQPPLRAPPA